MFTLSVNAACTPPKAAAHRANHDPEVPAGAQQAFVVVGRVVMPRESVALMIASLTAALEASEPQGSAPPQPPPH